MGSRQIMEPASDWNVASSCWVFWLDVNNVAEKVPGLLGREEKWELKQCSAMRPFNVAPRGRYQCPFKSTAVQ